MTQLRQKMLEELQRRNYSDRTAKTYIRIIRDFAKHFHQPPDRLGPEQIRQYQAYLFHTKKLSPSTVHCQPVCLRATLPLRQDAAAPFSDGTHSIPQVSQATADRA
ncbi:MAG TPA: site-specific integrase [Terriglobales bacterium]